MPVGQISKLALSALSWAVLKEPTIREMRMMIMKKANFYRKKLNAHKTAFSSKCMTNKNSNDNKLQSSSAY
jgi:hypothetical protein